MEELISQKHLKRNKMTKEQATLKVQGFRGNYTDEEIAGKLGISKPTLYTRLKQHNWKKGEIELIKILK